MKLTDIFFDTDCLSSFLWVGREDIFLQLYPNLIVIPDQVYSELSRVTFLKNKVDSLISNNRVKTMDILLGTQEYSLYEKMTRNPDLNITSKIIGNGEASAIALCVVKGGILASNNLRDIQSYVNHYSIKSILTEDILVEAFNKRLITEQEGNNIWNDMLNKRRRLPYATFTDCLNNRR